jgi:hypothetical protein
MYRKTICQPIDYRRHVERLTHKQGRAGFQARTSSGKFRAGEFVSVVLKLGLEAPAGDSQLSWHIL